MTTAALVLQALTLLGGFGVAYFEFVPARDGLKLRTYDHIVWGVVVVVLVLALAAAANALFPVPQGQRVPTDACKVLPARCGALKGHPTR